MLGRLAFSVAIIPVIACSARAQDSAAAATPERVATSGVFSEQQAQRGEGVYRTSCQSCHAKNEYTGDKFKVAWVSKTAYDIFDSIRTLMPDDNPGSLERQEYIDVVAYIFSLNAFPAGSSDLPGDDDGLKKVRIDNPPGSFASRPAARAVAHPRVTFRR
jgi:mono/diheme cytochrome c family protein